MLDSNQIIDIDAWKDMSYYVSTQKQVSFNILASDTCTMWVIKCLLIAYDFFH